MLINYIRIACRNLWRSKGFSFINLIGLAIGMASAILILLWIQNELSYDAFHKNKARLYEVWNRGTFDGKLQCWNTTPQPLGPALKQEVPEIEEEVRVYARWYVTVVGERKFSSKAFTVDPSFLSMFTFPLIKGDPATALNDVSSIVITEKMAKKMFGNEDAMNRTIRIDMDNFRVTGILKDLPINSTFDFDYLLPWSYMKKTGQDDQLWGNNSAGNYVLLKPGATETAANLKIKDITKKQSNGEVKEELFLHPVTKWHLYSDFENGRIAGGRIGIVRLFGIIAAFILLIACINFMNLSTARSERRAKEVGIRKMAGARKGSLIMQFLCESILIAFFAAALAFPLVQWALPAFDRLVNKQLTVPYDSFSFWMSAIAFILLTGIIAGSYPAFFLSSFQPVKVLKGTFKRAHALINPRKVLVVIQFSFAIILIISTFIVVRQIRYAQQRQSGYERSQLVYHWLTGDLNKNFSPVKQSLLSSGLVTSITRSNLMLTERGNDSWDFQWQGKAPGDKIDFDVLAEDEALVKTAGLQLLKGRDMDLVGYPTDSTAMLLNESAVKAMGFKEPIGQLVQGYNGARYHVIGVIKDFILGSPYDHIRPMIIEGTNGGAFNVLNIRFKPGSDMEKDLRFMEQLFREYNPSYPFEYHFANEDYARKFDDTQRVATLTALFSALTIFISCLGLFGLAAYMTTNRIKEIGVRKVLGASVFRITALLTKDFLALVALSIIIATPVAWYAMHRWLQEYEYRIDIQWWVFLLAGVLAVIISLLTVSYQAIRAAMANPVKSLRTD
ncbi:MAG TPA: ABC transporter permease [Puia sp.]|nr:ABC transporter permease [Puia sp.]